MTMWAFHHAVLVRHSPLLRWNKAVLGGRHRLNVSVCHCIHKNDLCLISSEDQARDFTSKPLHYNIGLTMVTDRNRTISIQSFLEIPW